MVSQDAFHSLIRQVLTLKNSIDMCGIAGIYFKQDVPADTLEKISDFFSTSLRHRGPDHYGCHIGERFVFANLRLAIVDRAGGNQPIYSPDGQSGIAYNGEVYNWETLRTTLETQGYPFKTHTDTESILAAYLSDGDTVFERLNGMFAACLWRKGGNDFVLVRDRFGSKPLYFYDDDNFFAYASEIKTLLGLPNIDTTLNPFAFQDYLTYRYTLAPHTFFQRIEKLPAGHMLSFDGKQIQKRAYAKLKLEEPVSPRSAESYLEELDSRLNHAVQSQLMGEAPIGLLLSGGLDSSTIAYYLNRNNVKLKAYSIGFPEINEFSFSREVAQHFDLDYQEVCLSQHELFNQMDDNILRLDEPIADPACFALSRLCADIRKDVTVVLSGEGGDELFAGYNQYLNVLNPEYDSNTCFAYYFYQSSNYDDASAYLKNKALPAQHLRYRECYDSADTRLNGMQSLDLHTWLPENLMMKADKILMSHSLEGRYPFLDLDLFNFAAQLPQAMKLPATDARKYILNELMRTKLPNSVVTRQKMGFAVPPVFFLRSLQSRFLETLDILRDQPVADILDLEAIKALVNDYYNGKPIQPFKVWNIYVLIDWFARAYPQFKQQFSNLSGEDMQELNTNTNNEAGEKSTSEQTFNFNEVDENEHLVPRPFGTLQTLNIDHLHRYAFAKSFCHNALVLDAAMGCGYASLILNCKHYTGIDIDPNMVAFAKQHYRPLIPNATYLQGSVLSLPLENSSVDTFISFETIEHIKPTELGDYLAEAKRVLKPGGTFLCSTPIYRGDSYGLLAKYHPYEFQYNHFLTVMINNGFLLYETWYQWPPYYTIQSIVPRFEQTQQLAPFIVVGVFKRPE